MPPPRERICLNGLWRWRRPRTSPIRRPTMGGAQGPRTLAGGTRTTSREDCQTLHVHPSFKHTNPSGVVAAWHQREITVPKGWDGRRVALSGLR
jgi:hypothetical protein